MNIDKLEIGDKVHVHYSFTDTSGLVSAYATGHFNGGIDKENDYILLRDGYYVMTTENNNVEKTSFEGYKIPLRFDPIILCERLLIEDISSLAAV